MNKRLLAGMMAGALLLGGAASADVDLSGMSYDELVALHDAVVSAIAESDGAVSFRAEPGDYIVGVDIPAGKYSVKQPEDAGFSVFHIYDEKGKSLKTEYFEPDNKPGKMLGQVLLEDGYRLELEYGAFLFAPSAGITFN